MNAYIIRMILLFLLGIDSINRAKDYYTLQNIKRQDTSWIQNALLYHHSDTVHLERQQISARSESTYMIIEKKVKGTTRTVPVRTYSQ
jgi:hypothetical protein